MTDGSLDTDDFLFKCSRIVSLQLNTSVCIGTLEKRGAGFDPAERAVEWTADPLNLIQVILAEGCEK